MGECSLGWRWVSLSDQGFGGSGWNTKQYWDEEEMTWSWQQVSVPNTPLVDLIVMEYTDISNLLAQIPCHAHGMPHVHESCTSYGHKKGVFHCRGITLKFPHSIHPWMWASKSVVRLNETMSMEPPLETKQQLCPGVGATVSSLPTSDLFFLTFIKRSKSDLYSLLLGFERCSSCHTMEMQGVLIQKGQW